MGLEKREKNDICFMLLWFGTSLHLHHALLKGCWHTTRPVGRMTKCTWNPFPIVPQFLTACGTRWDEIGTGDRKNIFHILSKQQHMHEILAE